MILSWAANSLFFWLGESPFKKFENPCCGVSWVATLAYTLHLTQQLFIFNKFCNICLFAMVKADVGLKFLGQTGKYCSMESSY